MIGITALMLNVFISLLTFSCRVVSRVIKYKKTNTCRHNAYWLHQWVLNIIGVAQDHIIICYDVDHLRLQLKRYVSPLSSP